MTASRRAWESRAFDFACAAASLAERPAARPRRDGVFPLGAENIEKAAQEGAKS